MSYVLTGTGYPNFGAGPKIVARPIIDTRSFFSSGDIFSLGIAAGLAIMVVGMITRRKARLPLSRLARSYHDRAAARHRKASTRHSRRIHRSLAKDVQVIGKRTKKSRRKRARLTAAMDEDWLQSLGK